MEFVLFIAISAMLVNNVIFSRFLGICPYIGVSKSLDTAVGMGFAVTFVMTLATFIVFLINAFILIPFKIEFLKTIIFILVIASLVQIVELVLRKISRPLYESLGIYLPLITTNCAILGVAILSTQNPDYNLFYATLFAFCSALGFMIAIIIFAGIRERLQKSPIPAPFKNVPIAFITASILALAFMGFAGLVK